MKNILFLIIIAFLPAVPQSQAPSPHKRITQLIHSVWQVKEGLPQNSVNAIVQTRDSYLWLGTYEGLVRFNGTAFSTFDRGNTPELLSNRITSLCEDRRGRLWIGSFGGGITVYDKGKFYSPVRDSSKIGNYVGLLSMIVDVHDRIWALTEKGIAVIRDSVIETTYPISFFGKNPPAKITLDLDGRIWVSAFDDISFIESGKVKKLSAPIAGYILNGPVPSRSGGVWFLGVKSGGKEFLYRYKNNFEIIDTLPALFAQTNIFPIIEDSRGTLWCCLSGDGIMKFGNGRWDYLGKKNGAPIENPQVMLEDTEGSMWLGTNGNGLHQFRDSRFTPLGISEGFSTENIWSLYEDSRWKKWIGVLNGGYYTVDDNGLHAASHGKGFSFFSFLEDKQQNIWAGGVSLIDRNEKIHSLPLPFLSFVHSLDSMGRVWFAPYTGGIRIAVNGKIADSISLGSSLAETSVRTMKTDRDGSMWIGTQNGLFHYHNHSITHYDTANGLPNNWIRNLYQDGDGTLWIATDGGLVKKTGTTFRSYSVKDGLYSNTIHVILEDDKNNLWMSSNKGIFVVRKNDLNLFDEHTTERISCTAFGEDDGMRSAEGNGSYQQGGWKMHDGTLWFATIKGIVIVNPNNLLKNTVVPPVVIEKIIADGFVVGEQSKNKMHFPLNDLSFHFASLCYRVPARIQYKYKLEGFQSNWVAAGNQNRAEFTHLPAGEYTFRVIACNDDGVWNMTGTSFSFTLPPPFWETWWFYTLAGLIVFGSTIGGVRFFELRKIKKRIEQLEHEKVLERERSRISKDMHDDIGSSLTQIAILSELAKRSGQKESQTHLEKISSTSREVIDNISQIIWAIDPKNDTLENTVAYLREYIAETFETSKMAVLFEFPDDIPAVEVASEFRRNVFLTVKEAINNIIKYSHANRVLCSAVIDRSRFSISITDNGRGFNKEEISRFGNGLKNMQKRIEDIGGVFLIESESGKGTTISFSIML